MRDAAAEAAALAKAEAAAKALGAGVRGRLVEELERNGPVAAVSVCADEARTITAGVAERTGVKVGRSSLRLRQPANAPPDWVGAWLRAQGERPAEGVRGIAEVVDTPTGRVARVLKPIAVESACLVCHGAQESIAPEVRDVLRARYPDDRATGYSAGDLRGALWAEAPAGASR